MRNYIFIFLNINLLNELSPIAKKISKILLSKSLILSTDPMTGVPSIISPVTLSFKSNIPKYYNF